MLIEQIVKRINENLAGELLTYNDLKIFMDMVIDDINAQLNTTYPVFTEFTMSTHTNYPDYNFFPEKYVRSVIPIGAAYYFFTMDEEGISTATQYQYKYQDELFKMQRDYIDEVPPEWLYDKRASLDINEDLWYAPHPVDFWEL